MRLSPIVTYILRRILISGLVLVGISFIAFTISYLLPSDPVTSRYPDITPEQREEIRRQMGLDQPLPVQYARYIQSVFRGEFGVSYNTGNMVIDDLKDRIPATLELAFWGLGMGIILGIPTGIISAVHRNKFWDNAMRLISIGSQSIPGFWIGVVLIFFLYFQWHIAPMPVGRLGMSFSTPETVTGFLVLDSILLGNWETALAALKQLAMPAFVMGLGMIAPIARITRSAMSESLQEDYIIFGRALGLPERKVVLGDAFRGSLVSIVTVIGFSVGGIFAGSAIVETVFAWPGLGRYAVTAITTSDMAPVNTCILLIATGVALANLLVDISYAFIDPRIRDEYARS
ncbi:MAG: ABC transporter permease [Chloroflexi bacterium]|mgnify:CR=1 FL=1|nr:ABC transporter permease [Chloroflexota bacterium]